MLDAFGRKSSFFHNAVRVQDAIFEGREERLAEVGHDVCGVSALRSGSVLPESARASGPFRVFAFSTRLSHAVLTPSTSRVLCTRNSLKQKV